MRKTVASVLGFHVLFTGCLLWAGPAKTPTPFDPEFHIDRFSRQSFNYEKYIDAEIAAGVRREPLPPVSALDSRIQEPSFLEAYPVNATNAPALFRSRPEEIESMARTMFKNEGNCDPKELVAFNSTETFPSLGLGHMIWYPEYKAGVKKPGFDESFPELIQYLRRNLTVKGDVGRTQKLRESVGMPEWLDQDNIGPAPWTSHRQVLAERTRMLKGERTKVGEVLRFLGHPTVLRLQSQFLFQRLQKGVYRMIASAELQGDSEAAQRIHRNFLRMAKSHVGIRTLSNYVNFKGEGILEGERTEVLRKGWGLKQVLENMDEDTAAKNPHEAFADSAQKMMVRLAGLAGSREEEVAGYVKGWNKRINGTYRNPKATSVQCAPFDNPEIIERMTRVKSGGSLFARDPSRGQR